MIEIVRWTLAAFLSNRDADDDALVELLAAQGVPRSVAAHAVVMLPIAFGRRLLQGLARLPGEVQAGERVIVLAEDPAYAAAAELAARAGRDEMQAVGLRSSEVHAVNAALNAGSQPGDLELAVTSIPDPGDLASAPAWAAEGVAELARSHGSKLAWSVRVFPRQLVPDTAQLQLDVVVPAGSREVIESFAGFGATIAEATADALSKFARSAFHVLMAVLEREELGADQVQWETWGDWRVCMGALIRQWSEPPAIAFGIYVDALRERLIAAQLSRELHWYRTFVAKGDEILGQDALLDNTEWPPGADLTSKYPWPRSARPYALRNFFALLPHG